MTRLLILLFALNTLLPSMGFAAMLSPDAKELMSQSYESTMVMASTSHLKEMDCANRLLASHDACDSDTMSNGLCKAKCATSCVSAPAQISILSLSVPFSKHKNDVNKVFAFFYSRAISPELRPPLA